MRAQFNKVALCLQAMTDEFADDMPGAELAEEHKVRGSDLSTLTCSALLAEAEEAWLSPQRDVALIAQLHLYLCVL